MDNRRSENKYSLGMLLHQFVLLNTCDLGSMILNAKPTEKLGISTHRMYEILCILDSLGVITRFS